MSPTYLFDVLHASVTALLVIFAFCCVFVDFVCLCYPAYVPPYLPLHALHSQLGNLIESHLFVKSENLNTPNNPAHNEVKLS